MPAPKIRADYDVLKRIASLFQREGQATSQTLTRLNRAKGTLQGGEWIGRGAEKFYQEMDSEVIPSVQRMAKAFGEAARVTGAINQIMQQAEDEAARILRGDGAGGGGPAPAGGSGGGAAGGGAGAGSGGSEPSAAQEASDRMLEDFSPKVRETANKSPSLQNQLQELEDDGWLIIEGRKGGGSYADRENKFLVIEEGRPAQDQVRSLGHEAGHAEYDKPPYHPPTDDMTRQEYIDQNVQEKLLDEGYAQLNIATVRDEINQNGGPDVGISGSQTDDYQAVYEQYKNGDISRDEAVSQMADLMGNETTSNTHEPYRDYYGKPFERYWDDHVAPTRGD